MTEHSVEPLNGRRAAHERLSTGALAGWARACASHPWRVPLGWLGIVAVLIGLVATVGGDLRDEFEIPGSETQQATDLIEAEFAKAPACGHCGSEAFSKWGVATGMKRYMCKACELTFNALTRTPLAHLQKREKWL